MLKNKNFFKILFVGYINIVAASILFMCIFQFWGAFKNVGRISANSGEEITFFEAITSSFSFFSVFAFVPKIFMFWNFKALFIALPIFVFALILAFLFNFKIYRQVEANFAVVSVVYFLVASLLLIIGSRIYIV